MFKDILTDVVILIFLLGYLVYSYIESLIRSLVPSRNFYKDVKGDTVLVTGAAGGIGSHLASKFFDLGCTVICVDNNKEELAKLKDRLIKEKLSKSADDNNNNLTSFKRLHFFNVDISSLDEIKSVSGRIRQDIGRVDILINNAGIMNKGKLLTELSDQEIKTIFDVNILAHFWLIREFLPEMIKINKGHICNVASVCGLMGSYKLTDYCSTKFAVVGLTESIRSELNGLNLRNRIKATVVCPFHVQTKLFNGVEFSRLGWAGLSMAPERVADQIVDGILSNKDIVYIPRFQTCLFYLLKNLTSSKFTDQAMRWLELNGAMDKYKSKSQ